MLSFECFIISVVEKASVFTTIKKTSSSIARITRVQQVFLFERKLHDRSMVFWVEELGLATAHCHDDSPVVVAELGAEDEAVSVLNI